MRCVESNSVNDSTLDYIFILSDGYLFIVNRITESLLGVAFPGLAILMNISFWSWYADMSWQI